MCVTLYTANIPNVAILLSLDVLPDDTGHIIRWPELRIIVRLTALLGLPQRTTYASLPPGRWAFEEAETKRAVLSKLGYYVAHLYFSLCGENCVRAFGWFELQMRRVFSKDLWRLVFGERVEYSELSWTEKIATAQKQSISPTTPELISDLNDGRSFICN